jgi:hypothetical protein
MDSRTLETHAVILLKTIKPELLKILDNAPAFGSSSIDIRFHDPEIVGLLLKAEVTKINNPRTRFAGEASGRGMLFS